MGNKSELDDSEVTWERKGKGQGMSFGTTSEGPIE
jgi:hypothetical protein